MEVSEIVEAVHPLIGEPLTDMWRYGGAQVLEFGVQRPFTNRYGEPSYRADRALVAACDWRIEAEDGTALSSEDYRPRRRDRTAIMWTFIDSILDDPPIVVEIQVEEGNGLRVSLSRGYVLTITPDNTPGQEEIDQWWLRTEGDPSRYFTIRSPE